MATLTPKKVTLSEINDGNEFVQGDGITSSAVNAPLEASAYSQIFAEGVSQAPDVSDAGNVGTPSVSFVDGSTVDGVVTKKLKFSNLKGATGATGPTGPSAIVINDLTTGGTTVALSAEQGKILNTNKESLSNKVTILSEESTDEEYPSAKVTYDSIQAIVTGTGFETKDNNPYELVSSGIITKTGTDLSIYLQSENKFLLQLYSNNIDEVNFQSDGDFSYASTYRDITTGTSFSSSTSEINLVPTKPILSGFYSSCSNDLTEIQSKKTSAGVNKFMTYFLHYYKSNENSSFDDYYTRITVGPKTTYPTISLKSVVGDVNYKLFKLKY